MANITKIGLIGFGTVGSGIVSVLCENAAHIFDRTGVEIEISRIADVDVSKKRPVSVDAAILTTDPYKIINDKEISIVVEAVGGTDPALKLALDSIQNGKNVVTTNKELIAKHGQEIFSLAHKKGVRVLFEGSVGGGIPIINQLRTCLTANRIEEVYGIVNGTTNYILTKMADDGRSFEAALKEAQNKGIAEANPKSDIEGYDASYKAAILASVAFDARVKWESVYFEGISKISQEDIRFAKEMGYTVKLLVILKRHGISDIEVRVHPNLISLSHPLSAVKDAFNAIYVRGNAVGEVMFYGEGAGGRPTASAAISDIIEIARNQEPVYSPKFKDIAIRNIKESESRFYIRLKAGDKAGVLADIAGAFGEKNVSIQSALQKETVDNIATVVIITHKVRSSNVFEALDKIKHLPSIAEIANVIRVGME